MHGRRTFLSFLPILLFFFPVTPSSSVTDTGADTVTDSGAETVTVSGDANVTDSGDDESEKNLCFDVLHVTLKVIKK